ncbi:MAG TPA: 16S rRNA (adenine(1518)-N(6)/adenine(1519)-N(6))-dimethyltransferase RsmA [Terracidiphilus sp.]|nr:16S rRNA (adenine(1518)-N(6)/adenine(1519)-N(6))-dimethyltransferase RsmA [Terracidiphilus sp.]
MPTRPRLGQNFLHNPHAIQRVVDALGNCAGRTAVEIGPGRGAITGLLAARCARLLAIELDSELATQLRAELHADPAAETLTVLTQDVLQFDFAAASAAAGQPLLVVGNLPFYITSPILLRLAAAHASLELAVLMVQREVADRVAARPGSRDYGLLSVTAQLYGPVELLFTLPPSAFSPPPKVHSAVLRWRFAPRFAQLAVPEKPFLAFLRLLFAQKRKTLANNLRAAGFAAADVAAALARTAIPLQARAESLPVEDFAALWHALHAEGAAPSSEAAP